MKKKNQRNFCITICLLIAFVLCTVAIRYLDVQAIGPKGSSVGFAALNGFFHNLTGVNMQLYTITDWLGLVPFGFVFGFAVLGLIQLIRRKSFLKVDFDILVLGGFSTFSRMVSSEIPSSRLNTSITCSESVIWL